MSYQAVIKIDLDEISRASIEAQMSAAMSSYVQGVQKTDISDWTYEEWQQLIAVAFDVAAVAVFSKRIVVIPPDLTDSRIPFHG